MTPTNLAYTEIERLVKNFKNIPASQRRGMNEMQTRLGYILPLFKALGWETSNINKVGSLVEKMLALQKERQSVRREDDLDRVRNLERQIAQVDEEIDQKVYVLYGLTEEEIKIIEK